MKIAAIQMCSSALVSENLKTAAVLIAEAAKVQAKLVVLPEMFPMIGCTSADKVSIKEAYGHGPIQTFLANQAKQHQIWIVGGTIPLEAADPNKISAACLVYNDLGEVVARYDKIHLFDVRLSEQEHYQESAFTVAGHDLTMVDTPIGKLGLAVCCDLRFPDLFQRYHQMGVQVMVLPSAFTEKTGAAHWEILLKARAIETFSYVIAAAQGGQHDNHQSTFGHTMIVSPWGEILAEQSALEPGVICAEIDLDYLYQIRQRFSKMFRTLRKT